MRSVPGEQISLMQTSYQGFSHVPRGATAVTPCTQDLKTAPEAFEILRTPHACLLNPRQVNRQYTLWLQIPNTIGLLM